MYFAYVIMNETGLLYKGHTEDLDKRIEQHNNGSTQTTRNKGVWKVVYSENFDRREDAIKREKYFKTAAGRRFLKTKLGN